MIATSSSWHFCLYQVQFQAIAVGQYFLHHNEKILLFLSHKIIFDPPGLQASNLAIRAISHLHVTKENYSTWLLHEILVAAVLGLGIGLLIAIIAYFTSNSDLSFACTIGIANFISILSAGLTGTLSPLVFTFIFHRDASKWGGPLETAIQDNVATFVMVIISYHILRWIPPLPQ